MATALPEGWPAPDSPLQVLPKVWADLGTPLGVQTLASFTLTRELTGSTIPGSIRAKSGLSIGTLSATYRNPATALPWSPRAQRPVANQIVPVWAGFGQYDDLPQVPLGSWLSQPISGNLTSPTGTVDLVESQYRGRRIPASVLNPGAPVDAAWLLTQLAAQAGFSGDRLDIPASIGVTVQYIANGDPDSGTPDTGWGWQADTDVWSAIQQVCAVTLCAAWVDVLGVLHIRTRQALTGVGVDIRTVDAGAIATDIPWTIDPADTADRLEITWTTTDGTAQTMARGLDASLAANVMTIDVGWLIHNAADATEIADHLWGRVSASHWRADSVTVVLDWTYDIGDVLLLQHARTGLSQRVLVTKIAINAQSGQYQQALDLVLLPWTWADFDQAWATAGGTWADFDTVWVTKTWDDFDDYPLTTS